MPLDNEIWLHGDFVKAGACGLVRMESDGDDWKVTGLVLTGSEINSQTLKNLPLNHLGTILRIDKAFATEARVQQPPDLRDLSDQIQQALDLVQRQADRRGPKSWEPPPRQRLKRPDRTDPDAHSRAVAAAYEEAVRLGKSPGPALAEEADVPLATAHGWIREARRRGFLLKGRPGRAG